MRIAGIMLVADHGAIGSIAVGLKTDLPMGAVGGEKAEVHASISRGFGVISHFFGPVLVVAD